MTVTENDHFVVKILDLKQESPLCLPDFYSELVALMVVTNDDHNTVSQS